MQFGSHVPEKTQTRQCCGHAPYQSPLMNNKSQHRAQHQHLHDIASQHQQQHSSKPILTSKQNRAFIEGMIWFKKYIYMKGGLYNIQYIYNLYDYNVHTCAHTFLAEQGSFNSDITAKRPSSKSSRTKCPVVCFVLLYACSKTRQDP